MNSLRFSGTLNGVPFIAAIFPDSSGEETQEEFDARAARCIGRAALSALDADFKARCLEEERTSTDIILDEIAS